MNNFDLSQFPSIQSGSLFTSLDLEIEKSLPSLPQTYERAEGAMRFCWFVAGDSDTLFSEDPIKRERLRQSFFRASLAEFVSMEDALKRDLENLCKGKKSIKISDSQNPLLHILRELRNLEIHLTSSTLSSESQKVIIDYKMGTDPVEQDITIWSVDNLDAEDFLKLNNAKLYENSKLVKAANLFLEAQKFWGINELLRRGINEYSKNIVTEYL